MKKVYVQPTMETEIYETNAYCGACRNEEATIPRNLVVDLAQGNWYKDNGGSAWDGKYTSGRQTLTYECDTRHTFAATNKFYMNNNVTGAQQPIWKCTCHNGEYYLEYSDNWTENYNNGNDTFFLYRETNGRDSLQLAGGTNWPIVNGQGAKQDTCVAQVKYTEDVVTIINS